MALNRILESENRVMAILGAGVSVPAGLPTSKGLIEVVKESSEGLARWVKFVEAKLEEKGKNFNVETIFNALVAYESRYLDPLDEFVETWADTPELGLLANIGLSELFEFHVMQNLRAAEQSALSHPESIEYLQPLFSEKVSSIVTLNYDRLVERAGASMGHHLDDGIEAWDGGYGWPTATTGKNFLKLHGSLDWRLDATDYPAEYRNTLTRRIAHGTREGNDPKRAYSLDPVAIFGGQNKISPQVCFPSLLTRFRELIIEAEALLIVGYSFADGHVNEAILRWMGMKPNGKIVVIDPVSRGDHPEIDIFEKLSGQDFDRMPATPMFREYWCEELKDRIVYCQESAEAVLMDLLVGSTEAI